MILCDTIAVIAVIATSFSLFYNTSIIDSERNNININNIQ